jgi:hypothetical protein
MLQTSLDRSNAGQNRVQACKAISGLRVNCMLVKSNNQQFDNQ